MFQTGHIGVYMCLHKWFWKMCLPVRYPIKVTLRHKRNTSKTEYRSKAMVIYLLQRMRELSNHLVQFHVFTY